jgi:hypothetical protein
VDDVAALHAPADRLSPAIIRTHKQYEKFSRYLRNELCSNNLREST